MPHDALPFAPVDARVAALNRRYRHHSAISVLEHALTDSDTGRVAMVSSFGADSVALLHMVAMVDRATPVIFIDTEMLFAETLAYQREVAATLGLRDVRAIRASRTQLAAHDPDGQLHRADPDACCALRKSGPLERALAPFDGWITGRRAQTLPVAPAGSAGILRGRGHGAGQDQPARPLGAGGCDRLHRQQPPAAPSARAPWLPLDRLRALHHAGRGGRGRARGPLARRAEGGMRHPRGGGPDRAGPGAAGVLRDGRPGFAYFWEDERAGAAH
jgi:hypothetical protein